MILKNLVIAGEQEIKDLRVDASPPGASPTGFSLPFHDAIAFPGLINSHDHLDFNLFPPLANDIYTNYSAWGRDIHKHNRKEIDAVLKIPQPLRTAWGIYKNLLNGVTTVVNHGEKLVTDQSEELISVFQDCHCLHSVGFEKNWKWKLNRPFTGTTPYVLHVGEGTDEAATREIDRLIRWNLFKKPLIGVHGVAMREEQAHGFRALVWCPATNYFLLDRTAPVGRLKYKLPVLFGTDSTLTAGWNIWEQLRLARDGGQLTDRELLDSVTTAPAAVWKIPHAGRIQTGIQPDRYADLVIAQPPASPSAEHPRSGGIGHSPGSLDSFFSLNPEDILLVIRRGRMSLFDGSLFDPLTAAGFQTENFHPVTIANRRKYVAGDLPGLAKKIREYHPGATFPFTIKQ